MTPAQRFEAVLSRAAQRSGLRIRTLRGGAIALVAEGVEFVLRLGSLFVLARLLVPEHFGLIAMVMAITAIAERFHDLGLALVTIQRQDIQYEHVNALFYVNGSIGLIVFVLIAACAGPIADFYDDPRLVAVTVAIATSFLFGGITIQHQALLRRQMAFGTLAAVQLSASALSIALAVLLAVLGFGYWALVAREVARSVFLAVGTWCAFPWVPGRPRWSRDIASMLLFGRDITAFNFLWFLAHNADQILIGKLFGASALGVYRQGVNLVLAPITQLYYPINSVAEAALSRLQHDPAQFRRYYVHLVGIASSLSMPIAAFLAVFADEIELVALGPGWTEASEFIRILAIAAFIRPAATTAGFVMTSSGHSRRYVTWGALVALSLVTCLIAGAWFGTSGIAWGHVAASYLLMLPLLHVGFRGTPVSVGDFVAATWRPMIASATMAVVLQSFASMGLHAGPAVKLAAGALMAVPAYFLPWLALPGGIAAARDALADLRDLVGQVR